jgi:glycosyltransferase involved in cell wall biosynthesis
LGLTGAFAVVTSLDIDQVERNDQQLNSGFMNDSRETYELGLNTLSVAEKQFDTFYTEQQIKVSVIIPVYNEQSTIAEVIDRVCGVDLGGLEKEIIIADDGSRDDTPSIVAEKHKQHPCVTKVHTSLINLGKGAAIRFGLEFTTGDIILVQDADLELNPEEFPALLAPILRGEADVVYGSRFRRRASNIPFRTRLANWFLTLFTNLLYGSRLTDMATAYKVFRSEVIKGMKLRSARFEFEPEVTAKLLLAGYRIVEVPISYNPRNVDEGKKVGWIDGIEYIYTLLKYRFFDGSGDACLNQR